MSPQIQYDVTDSDPDKAVGGTFEQPKPGVYRAKVREINSTFAKDSNGKPDKQRPMLEVIYEITEKKYSGSRMWDYVSFSDAAKWKLDQFLLAFGVAKPKAKRKGSFDTDDVIGESCKIRVKGETYQGEYRAKVGAVIASLEDEDEDSEDLEDEDDVEEDDVEEEEDETEDEDETDEEDYPYYAEADLQGQNATQLREIADNLDLEPPSNVSKNAAKLRKWILENQPTEEVEVEVEDEDAEDDGYEEMSQDDLKAECKDRSLPNKGSKTLLIKRLRDDDAEDPF